MKGYPLLESVSQGATVKWSGRSVLVLVLVAAFALVDVDAQLLSVYPPEDTALTDPVALLSQKLQSGELRLDFEEPRGYLDSLLRELRIPTESQLLVFSKTSLQSALIAPDTPRALYFNDDVYVGWVQDGLIEIASTDPRYGTIFYTVGQSPDRQPLFQREGARCINCHLPGRQEVPVPRLMVMSVIPNDEGTPLGLSVELTTDRSPLGSRWGGWYVTGTDRDGTQMGNSVATADRTSEWDIRNPRQLESVSDRFDASVYLRDTSDAAALLVLTHQAEIHNLIAELAYAARRSTMRDDAEREPRAASERLQDLVEPLVRALFFVDATPLDAPLSGSSLFAQRFADSGPHDTRGRSLRELELETTLLRYPLSYMVYSDSFEQLPGPALDHVYSRSLDILAGRDSSLEFSHLSPADRAAVLEILLETSPSFRDWFHRRPAALR